MAKLHHVYLVEDGEATGPHDPRAILLITRVYDDKGRLIEETRSFVRPPEEDETS